MTQCYIKPLIFVFHFRYKRNDQSERPTGVGCGWGTGVISHWGNLNHGPSKQSSKEEYRPRKWGATARYYASHTKTMLPTRKSVPRSSRQLDHTKTSWPSETDANCSGMVMPPIPQVWPKSSCKAQWKGEEDKADRGRGGKTTSGNGWAWSSPSPRGQWRTGNKLRKLVAKSSVMPQRHSRLRDRWDEKIWLTTSRFTAICNM